MAEPGAGVNFIITQLHPEVTNSPEASAAKNEYVISSKTIRMSSCDQPLMNLLATPEYNHDFVVRHDVSHLDQVEKELEQFYIKNPNEINIMYSHEAPYVLLNALDVKIDLVTRISLDQETTWIASGLQMIKNYQGALANAGTFKFVRILEDYYLAISRRLATSGNISDLQFSRHRRSIANLVNQIDSRRPPWTQIEYGAPIVYMYYIEAIENRDPVSLQGFSEYYTRRVKDFFEYNGRHSAADVVCESLSDQVPIQTVSYEDLYFNLKLPQSKVWQHVNPANIADYSRKNLVLLNSMCEILNEPLRGDVSDRLAAYADQLSRAAGHHSTV